MADEKLERLKARVRETPLAERLETCRSMIGQMCSNGRPPKMTIPVQHDDEDFFISTTLGDALEMHEAFEDVFKMINYALESRDALLISKTCPTMLKANTLMNCETCGLDYEGAFVHKCRGYRLTYLEDGTPLVNGEKPLYKLGDAVLCEGNPRTLLVPLNEAARLMGWMYI